MADVIVSVNSGVTIAAQVATGAPGPPGLAGAPGAVGTVPVYKLDQVPVELPNGSRTVFTLPNGDVAMSGTIGVSLNGLGQTHGGDYTESSTTTITFIAIPLTGDIIRLNYRTT